MPSLDVTAKVKIYSIAPGFSDGGQPHAPEQMVSFTADYITPEGKEKNSEWSKYTPSLNLVMTVKSEVVERNGWEVGKSYMLTITESE